MTRLLILVAMMAVFLYLLGAFVMAAPKVVVQDFPSVEDGIGVPTYGIVIRSDGCTVSPCQPIQK